jgi:hypothetical protein
LTIFLLSPNEYCTRAKAIPEVFLGLGEKRTGCVPSFGHESKSGWAGGGIVLAVYD